MADEWDDIEIPEPVVRAVEKEENPEPEPIAQAVELTAEQKAREEKRLASIAARRAESAMLDAERKAREAEKAEKKRKEEEEETRRRASMPKKSDFEREKEAFIHDFIMKRKEQDKKTGKGHLWISRVHHKTKSVKTSEGEVKASQDAEVAWKIHKNI